MKYERHPRLTPLRALALLRRLEAGGDHPQPHVLRDLRDALSEHIAAHLIRSRRRREKRDDTKALAELLDSMGYELVTP